MENQLEQKARDLLAFAGVTLNGPAPYDIQVHDEAVYRRAFGQGTLGVAESYMDGQWDAQDLSEFFSRVMGARIDRKLKHLSTLWYVFRARFTNMQSKSRAFEVGEEHYDLGNDLFEAMLGHTLAYTCGYWKDAKNLDEAQEAKFDLICRKIGLKPGQTVLDVGCGWGSFLKFAAEKYGAKGVGITVSKEQAALVRERFKHLPIEIRVEDYRDTTGQFDHIVSIGMFEHVGPHNYRVYMKKMHSLLKDGGLFLLHTIGGNFSTLTTEAFIGKYIFPNGVLPSAAQIGTAIDDLFVMEDWHSFGTDYDKTLMAWFENFDRAWPQLKTKYSERFYRMWKYYLLSCAGSFRSRQNNLWQIVLSKEGVLGGYTSVR
jgi:cyclopropane-fatty-acyl-phospholipid synthase